MPIILIHATEPKTSDIAKEKGISEIKRNIKDFNIVPVKDAAHMVQWDTPLVVSDEIFNWTKKIEDNRY